MTKVRASIDFSSNLVTNSREFLKKQKIHDFFLFKLGKALPFYCSIVIYT